MSELDNKWLASQYLDDGRWGVVAESANCDGSPIVIGLSVGLDEETAQKIAKYHNDRR